MLSVVCVYKSGGPYNANYVRRLQDGVRRNLTVPHNFICLTDRVEEVKDFCLTIPLRHNWPGWWSKIELFRPDLFIWETLYLDLDTVILGNIDLLADTACKIDFTTLRGFNQKLSKRGTDDWNIATGVMAGDISSHSAVYLAFTEDPEGYMAEQRKRWRNGDQGFIASIMGMGLPALQDYLPEDYIVGRKISSDGKKIPAEAKILAWCGEPRLHEVKLKPLMDFWRLVGE